jgi:glycosyltransferase involved in cell wall biosynthesis
MTEGLVPKVSVLMSVYYKETPRNLDQCLESLANQTVPANEIVVVKDGELPVALEETLVSWQKKLPLKIVGYEENKGLAYALNYGLDYCSNELVARMDSDDICLPDRFEKQLEYFKHNKDAVIIGTSILEFYEEKI